MDDMKRLIGQTVFALITSAASVAGTIYFLEPHKMTRVHELAFPLMLQGSAGISSKYLLPKGTWLYYDKAFPEGFVRYRIYVNVDGVKLESRELADSTITPLTAYPIGKPELLKLLRDHPLSKGDLASILQSGQLTKEEIREVLREFSQ